MHLDCRTILYQLLSDVLGEQHLVCSDQFLYWNAADARQCLGPDVAVRLGTPHQWISSWKTWELGAPHLAIEVVSAGDAGELPWNQKLARYAACGVRELVRFDPNERTGERVRVWDRIDEDLVEREVRADQTPCAMLPGLHWVVAPADRVPAALRLARVAVGRDVVPTRVEARRIEQARVAELEAELRRRG